MNKEICKLSKKELKEKHDQLVKIVSSPQYLCIKCGRAANKKKFLCKAEELFK